MVGRAFGLEQNHLIRQREFLEAKSRIVQSKSNLIDGEFEQAAQEMGQALTHLKKAFMSEEGSPSPALTEPLVSKVEAMKEALASGEIIPRNAIDEIQRSVDHLLAD
jgi:primosomal protein N''